MGRRRRKQGRKRPTRPHIKPEKMEQFLKKDSQGANASDLIIETTDADPEIQRRVQEILDRRKFFDASPG